MTTFIKNPFQLFVLVCILVTLSCTSSEEKDTSSSEAELNTTPNQDEEEVTIDYQKYGMDSEQTNDIKALNIGDVAPDFSGTDQFGNEFTLSETLQENQVLLIFYRGYWCPYCTKYLATFADQLETLRAKGVQVIAISPEGAEYIDQTVEKTNLEIPFIHDKGQAIMNAYHVAFNVTNAYDKKIEDWKGISLTEINDGQEEAILPVPATYLIGQDGKIKWVHFDPDYKQRPSVEDILEQL